MSKKRSKNNKIFREKIRDKSTGEFLNDQIKENGMTDKGNMLSMYNTNTTPKTKNKKG